MRDPVKVLKRKLTAIAEAERRLKRRLEDIDWRENELHTALESVDALIAAGEMPDFNLVEGGGLMSRLKTLTAGADAEADDDS